MNNNLYQNKYLKYKNKYLNKLVGGAFEDLTSDDLKTLKGIELNTGIDLNTRIGDYHTLQKLNHA